MNEKVVKAVVIIMLLAIIGLFIAQMIFYVL
jgi:hypothetical protein